MSLLTWTSGQHGVFEINSDIYIIYVFFFQKHKKSIWNALILIYKLGNYWNAGPIIIDLVKSHSYFLGML